MVTINAEKNTKYAKKYCVGTVRYNAVIAIAVNNSINGYNAETVFLQYRHFVPNKIQESTGILSYHAICFLQCGQKERGVKKLPLINRYATTFKNDPQHKKNGIKINKLIFILLPLFYPITVQCLVVFQMLYQI